jgi:uncharacterized protein (TIGR03790 family)
MMRAGNRHQAWLHISRLFLWLAFLTTGHGIAQAQTAAASLRPEAAKVLVLANSDDAESMRLAEYYMTKRGIPAANLFAYPLPKGEEISWELFVSSLWHPLLLDLISRGWLDATLSELKDAMGRNKLASLGHKANCLVVCRGVPLRIQADPVRLDKLPPSPFQSDGRLLTNMAALDSELSTLPLSQHLAIGLLPNPLFLRDKPGSFELSGVLKVSRLDAPSLAAAKALVDNAIETEETGLNGRAYVDLGGPYPEGDGWFGTVEKIITLTGYDMEVDRGPGTFSSEQRFDSPALYFGWYTGEINGPFTVQGFSFPKGAIAFHLHSWSAGTLREPQRSWCGPLIERGAAATLGNVSEPYLGFTHRPDAFLKALFEGRTLVEAAYYAMPVLSWQSIVIGDPLYRPFTLSEEAQWKRRSQLGNKQLAYLILRKMHLLQMQGKNSEALELGLSEMDTRPSLPLALGLAKSLLSSSRKNEVPSILGFVSKMSSDLAVEWPLHAQAAQLLAESGDYRTALEISQNLLAKPKLSPTFRRTLLLHCIDWAKALSDFQRQLAFEQQLQAIP